MDRLSYGKGMFIAIILVLAGFIVDAHGWPIGIFCFLLMIAVFELAYRLSLRS